MCRFPASGSSRKSFARGCVPMDDPCCWQWVTREEIIQSIPVEPTPTIPTRQPFLPDPDDLIGVPAQSFDVARDAVVGIVAPHHHRQMGVLVADGLMPVGPTPICNRTRKLAPPPFPRNSCVSWHTVNLRSAASSAIIRTSEHFHVFSPPPRLSVRMFGSGGKKRALAIGTPCFILFGFSSYARFQ